ncbi:Maintenance of mitochondrial morphology 1 [Lecanosticta acicola]|uniref:Maintenance of mitochondrial morphology protein 1 n=1 Tax=Lecanosticta acicola TaxID=111012 RepID=A0AAI8Z601_9PEZI|nr:Maintenance of mitochondrial morphology 1 [Lecanosticta acicola]
MSKAKQQAYHNAQQQYSYPPPSSGSFASGFIFGQLLLALILFIFIKFFIFGEAPSADERAAARAAARRQRTLSHTRQRTLSTALRPRPSAAVLKPRNDGGLTVQKILEKTYYNVQGHQPESLDWFNVLIAQTIAQLRADAQEDEAVLGSLTQLLNGASKPDFIDDIRVTEISLGEEFPIFSNCRVIPVDENGVPLKELTGQRGERLQARMDVDLSDVVTLGIETKLVLNYPKPFVMVLPVALAVSVTRFSGTLSLSFSPSNQHNPYPAANGNPADGGPPGQPNKNEGHPLNPTGHSPTTLTFTFLDDYRLDLSVHSLIGSRSRLQDVPKIAQLVEGRIHQWFDDRCVEPRFQQIVLPSLWPRKRNTRGGEEGDVTDDNETSQMDGSTQSKPNPPNPRAEQSVREDSPEEQARPNRGPETTAEQRTRDWAAQHASPNLRPRRDVSGIGKKEEMSEIELAGQEMRDADERDRKKKLGRTRTDLGPGGDSSNLRMRTIREASHDGAIRAAS